MSEEQQVNETAEQKKAPCCLILELEGVAVHGRKNRYDVMSSILEDQATMISPPLFSRYCLAPHPKFYMEKFLKALGVTKLTEAQAIEDVLNGVALNITSGNVLARPGVQALVEASIERGVPVALMTSLPSDVAESLVEQLGWSVEGVSLYVVEDVDRHYPRADTWLRAARAVNASPRRSLALASSHAAVKAAVSAGLRCVAISDEFTAFQDFGGAEFVFDSLQDITPAEVLEVVCPKED